MPHLTAASVSRLAASASLIALIFLCLLWETVLAPLKPGGSFLMLKALPLLAPLFGILHGKLYTYRWTALLALLYFCEGIVRTWADTPPSQWIAAIEIVFSVVLNLACIWYVRTNLKHCRRAIDAA